MKIKDSWLVAFLYILAGFLLILAVIIYLSPYGKQEGFSYKLMKHTITVNAPVGDLYRYLGNSDNARDWSVYVDHITTLNADSVPDGSVGSKRRCFVNPDETGTRWDETISENIADTKRQITIYNMIDFPLTADNLATEQLYKKIDENTTELTFSVFYLDAEPSFFEILKTHAASYRIISIFKDNMENIKSIVESRQ